MEDIHIYDVAIYKKNNDIQKIVDRVRYRHELSTPHDYYVHLRQGQRDIVLISNLYHISPDVEDPTLEMTIAFLEKHHSLQLTIPNNAKELLNLCKECGVEIVGFWTHGYEGVLYDCRVKRDIRDTVSVFIEKSLL